METLCINVGIQGINPISGNGLMEIRNNPASVSMPATSASQKKMASSISRFSFKYPLKSLWSRGGGRNRNGGLALDDAVLVESGEGKIAGEGEDLTVGSSEGENGSWVWKILQVRSIWKEEEKQGNISGDRKSFSDKEEKQGNVAGDRKNSDEEDDECDVCRVDDDDENEIEFDRDSFSRLLRRVSLPETRMYAQMSYLGNLAYSIPKLKPGNLPKCRGIRFVTSSVEKKEMAPKAETDAVEGCNHESESAANLHSDTRSILPTKTQKSDAGEDGGENIKNPDVVSLMATPDSVTSVVAAKEEVKQAVANDLNSTLSSPCDWFICDDDQTGTRFFIIQGSESLASWQANLLFEPVQFEGFDVLVHRGIYEAAKGIYEQMLTEVHAHLKSRGRQATFRFTGHSLGGSLALLVNLMLLIRGEVPRSSLLPVIMFGAPSIMCGGDQLLDKLGLPRSYVQGIMMHRDIVPRAFSCNYPNHVAELLKAVNGNFRNHPCLNNQKLLYAPMGELLILQPDENFSPHHHLLPSGSGLYLLSCHLSDTIDAKKQLQAAKKVFFNSPHPLEILSDRSAYGSEGTIMRDHDMNSYLKSVRTVIRQELNQMRKFKREHRRKIWWPLVSPRGLEAGRPGSISIGQDDFNFSGMLQTGKQSLKRFSRLIASEHMHFLVVLLFPAKLLFLGAYR